MSWKCVCKEENNTDESKTCKNCGRTRPKYLGVKLDLGSMEKMTNDQKAVWYLMIAHDYLLESDEYLKLDKDLSKKLGDESYNQAAVESNVQGYRGSSKTYSNRCLNVLKMSTDLSPEAQFENENGFISSAPSIKSSAYFNLGSVSFRSKEYQKAIEYYQKSYDSDPNQVSIFNIAMATINLPAEGGGMFSGKKTQAAKETKKEQEIDLLKKTIVFAPFSGTGRESAKILLEDYGITEFDI